MRPDVRTHLEWIRLAIEEMEQYAPLVGGFAAFKADRAKQLIVERCLIVIGEAVVRIGREAPELPLSEMKKIIMARNIIVHDYERVSIDILFIIYDRHIPLLKSEVEALLK